MATLTADTLRVTGLTVLYGRVRALEAIDLRVGEGELVCLLGANGAGKSSLLNSIAGLVPAASGRIEYRGEDITGKPCHRRNHAGISLAPEGRRVLTDLTVEENLRLAGARVPKEDLRSRTDAILELFPILESKRHLSGGALSGGQQQQLAIGRAVISEPSLLLLDEPSLGLDPINTAKIFDSLGRLKRRGYSILLAEQNVTRALELADRAYVLDTGRVTIADDASKLSAEAIEEAYLGLSAAPGGTG